MTKKIDQNKDILNKLISCLQYMNLPVKKEVKKDDHVTVYSENSIGIIKMYIQTSFFKKHNVLGMCIRFSHGSPEERIPYLYGVINHMNSMLMDVGGFCIHPVSGEISIRTGFGVPEGRINGDQFIRTLTRLMCHGCRGFEPIARAVIQDTPFKEIMRDFLEGMSGKDNGSLCTIKNENLN